MEINEIKTRLTLAEVIKYYGFKADKQNRICCPFHEDKTPSMQLYWKTHTAYCFSSNCTTHGKSLDQIDFIMHIEKISKHEAIKKAESLISGTATPTQELTRTAVLTKMFIYFKNAVHNSKPAQDYLKKRGLDPLQIEVGYNTAQFHHGDRKEEALIQSCVNAGLLSPWGTNSREGGQAYKPFAKYCIAFALKNRANQITGLYFRSTENDSDQRHFYLKDRQGLYPCYPKSNTKKLILTESIIDAASLLQSEEVNKEYSILALYGTNGFTEEHSEALSQLKELEEIIFFLNGDEPGRKATEKHTETVRKLNPEISISTVNVPENEDVNSLLVAHEPGIFAHLLERRTFIFSSEIIFESKQPVTDNKKTAKELLSTVNNQLPALITTNPELLIYDNSELHITILGGIRITGLDRMKVTLKVQRKHYTNLLPLRHSLDLYNSQQTEQLITKIAENLEVSRTETARTIAQLTAELENYRHSKIEAAKPQKEEKKKLTETEIKEAISYLKKPNLMARTMKDIGRSGITGEETNRIIAYLIYTSRKRAVPMHLMSLGASGTGKTYLQEKVSELIPEEDKLEITTLSENAFYYFGQEELKQKLILIEDLDGAESVLYPLRELQSKRKISKTVTLKDSKGNLKTITLTVEGPVCVSGCTTREKIYEDNANRCIMIYIDGSREQDNNIMAYQRRQSAGEINHKEEQTIKELLKNTQRVLKPIAVRNPYANYIQLPEAVFKPRRTMNLLLSFIETVTFYHQYQRTVKTDEQTQEPYIESTPEDIETAFILLTETLLKKSDELNGATRNFFERIKSKLQDSKTDSFYSKEIRESFRLSPSSLQRYLFELERMNCIKVISGSRYKGYEYKITKWEDLKNLEHETRQLVNSILQTIKKVSTPVAHQ